MYSFPCHIYHYTIIFIMCIMYHAYNRIISYIIMPLAYSNHMYITYPYIIFLFILIVCSITTLSSFISYTLHAFITSHIRMLMHMHTYVSCTFITFAHIHAYMASYPYQYMFSCHNYSFSSCYVY